MSKGDVRAAAWMAVLFAQAVALCAWVWTVVYHAPLWYIIPASIVAYLCMVAAPVTFLVKQWRRQP